MYTIKDAVFDKQVSYSFVGLAKDLLADFEMFYTAHYDELTEDQYED